MRTWVIAVLLILPMAAAQTPGINNPNVATPTTMYPHISGFQDFPINTQKPDDSYAASPGFGVTTHTQQCVTNPLVPGLVRGDYHTWYGYSSPGYVEYDQNEGGEPYHHPERGISFDVDLAGDSVDFRWFFESQVTAGNGPAGTPNPNMVPTVIPNVVVRATIREGDAISVGSVALNSGTIIAQGQSQPFTMAGPATQATPEMTPIAKGDKWLYQVDLALDLQEEKIRAEESFNLRVDIFLENPTCNDPDADHAMIDQVRIHTSPEHRPKFVWQVMNPLRIESLHPQLIADEWVFHTFTNSPWGNYDVSGDSPKEAGGMDLKVTGPSTVLSLEQVALTARTHEHNHHTEAIAAVWSWNFGQDNAKDGVYTVEFTVTNDQTNANATAYATFDLKGDVCAQQEYDGEAECINVAEKETEFKESPGFGLVALLAVVALALRRRT